MHDPRTVRTVIYRVRAVSEQHAERQGLDGFTGLLGGDIEERQKMLNVKAEVID